VLKPHLLYLTTEDSFFCSHFIERARAAIEAGFRVTVVTRVNDHGDVIRQAGLNLIHLNIDRRALDLRHQLRILLQVANIFKTQRPDIVHNVAIKPILIGTLAARLAKVRLVVNAPVGMGYVYASKDFKAWLLRPVLRLAFGFLLNPQGSRVVFENRDDFQQQVNEGFVRKDMAVLIRGAGINLDQFRPVPEPEGEVVVVLVARMLRDKGVYEFVEAARLLRAEGVAARFRLIGAPDPGNPASIDVVTLTSWNAEKCVEWLGHRSDILEQLSASHIACLPSYREGLPKSLLEALACGRAVVTTDVPGCREVVVDGENGFLVPARDSSALASALKILIKDAKLRSSFGVQGRARAEAYFGSERVVSETLKLYQSLIRGNASK